MAGQWITGGGLIRAASSGRFVMQFICRDLARPFRTSESRGSAAWQASRIDALALPQLDEELPEPSPAIHG
jgi:hypothetical protein